MRPPAAAAPAAATTATPGPAAAAAAWQAMRCALATAPAAAARRLRACQCQPCWATAAAAAPAAAGAGCATAVAGPGAARRHRPLLGCQVAAALTAGQCRSAARAAAVRHSRAVQQNALSHVRCHASSSKQARTQQPLPHQLLAPHAAAGGTAWQLRARSGLLQRRRQVLLAACQRWHCRRWLVCKQPAALFQQRCRRVADGNACCAAGCRDGSRCCCMCT